MTENQEENKPIDRDAAMLSRARQIVQDRGVSLIEAMIEAEGEMQPKQSALPASFVVEIPVKPRVAQWVLAEFQPTATHTTEERLAAYLATVLGRVRVHARRQSEAAPEIERGAAVTMTRENFKRVAPQ